MILNALRLGLSALLALAGCLASAHEFWILPDRFASAPDSAVSLSLAVGENFAGESVAFSPSLIAQARRISASGPVDLRTFVPRSPQLQISIPLPRSGTHLVAVDTHPSEIVLESGRFHAYLHDEGLDWVIAAREAAGTAAAPGRERYRRNIKTLLNTGNRGDTTYAQSTGQRLEIVPISNPFTAVSGAPMSFRVTFDGKPLARSLMKFWHRADGQVTLVRAVSDEAGRVAVTLAPSGIWMASVVHMVQVKDSVDHDWDSFWGNLTFLLQQ